MRYLGLDLSLTGTGICLLDDDDGTSIHELATVTTKNIRGPQRLCTIRDAVQVFLHEQPKLVAIENYSFGSAGRSFDLGELGGVIRVTVYELAIPYVVVAPAQLKKFATGRAGAEKRDVMRAADALVGHSVGDDNQADALFLAHIARALHASPAGLTRAQSEVIVRLRYPGTKKRRRHPRRDKTAI